MIRPKKSLGQHFLTSKAAVHKMVIAGECAPGKTVLEIGPGKGFLTEALLLSGVHVVAIEKDHDCIEHLTNRFHSYVKEGTFLLKEGDVMSYEPTEEPYSVIANIPYYITGAIIEKFLSAKHQPDKCILLVQKEVATRIVARDKKHSLLSLSVHVYATPRIVTTVSRGSFFPIPSVDSAVIELSAISRNNFTSSAHEQAFFTVIKYGFAHKRKVLVRNLSDHIKEDVVRHAFEELSLDQKVRAEDVTLATWLKLSSILSPYL